eukprot:gene9089-6382_t
MSRATETMSEREERLQREHEAFIAGTATMGSLPRLRSTIAGAGGQTNETVRRAEEKEQLRLKRLRDAASKEEEREKFEKEHEAKVEKLREMQKKKREKLHVAVKAVIVLTRRSESRRHTITILIWRSLIRQLLKLCMRNNKTNYKKHKTLSYEDEIKKKSVNWKDNNLSTSIYLCTTFYTFQYYLKMGKKKTENDARSETKAVIPTTASDKMRVKYVKHPYSWLNLFLSLEVLLSGGILGFVSYLLFKHPSELAIQQLMDISMQKSDFRLQNRSNEKSVGAPVFIEADLALVLLGCMAVCFFLSACSRVIMKAQNKHNKEVLEEALRLHYSTELREKKKEEDQKTLEEGNAERAKQGLRPLRPYINASYICGDDVLINMLTVVCLIYSVVLCCVLFVPINQIRGFGLIMVFSSLIGGLVCPKIYDDLLTLQHYCGILQNVFAAGILLLVSTIFPVVCSAVRMNAICVQQDNERQYHNYIKGQRSNTNKMKQAEISHC